MLLVFEDGATRVLKVNESFASLWTEAVRLEDFTVEQLADVIHRQYDIDFVEASERASALVSLWEKEGLTER